jgi:hypothetical protein
MLRPLDVRPGHHSSEFDQTALNAGNCSLEDDGGLLKGAALPDQSLQITIILLRPRRFCLAHTFNPLKRVPRHAVALRRSICMAIFGSNVRRKINSSTLWLLTVDRDAR